MPTASSSFSVSSTLPIQCAWGVFCDAPSKVTLRSAIALNQCPKSHQELMIASGADCVLIFVSESYQASLTMGTSFSAVLQPARTGRMSRRGIAPMTAADDASCGTPDWPLRSEERRVGEE